MLRNSHSHGGTSSYFAGPAMNFGKQLGRKSRNARGDSKIPTLRTRSKVAANKENEGRASTRGPVNRKGLIDITTKANEASAKSTVITKPKVEAIHADPVEDGKSQIKANERVVFDQEFTQLLDTTMATKITAKKFQATEKVKQQRELIKALRSAVGNMRKKNVAFVAGCVEVEKRLLEKADSIKGEMDTLACDRDRIQGHVKQLSDDLASSSAALVAMKAKEVELTDKFSLVTSELADSNAASTKLKNELDALKVDLQAVNATAELLKGDFARVSTQLEQKQREFAELQIKNRENLVKLQSELNAQIDEYKENLVDATVELKKLNEEKSELLSKIQKNEVQMATLTGDALRMKEKAEFAEAERERTQANLKDLEARFQAKNDEVMATVANFSRSQAFSESQIRELTGKKESLETQVQGLLEVKSSLENENEGMRSNIADINTRMEGLEKDFETTKADYSGAQEQLEAAKDLHSKDTQAWREKQNQHDNDVLDLKAKLVSAEGKVEVAQVTLETFKKHNNVTEGAQLDQICKLSMEVDVLRKQLNGKDTIANELMKANEDLKECQKRLFQAELVRREMHNRIQDLRGSVRVVARVRPFLKHDGEQTTSNIQTSKAKRGLDLKTSEGKTHNFVFDEVFGQKSTQKEIFEEVSNLVQSALDGFNVCLFSYGQTGSGKTYTMQGAGDGEERGMIPRSIEQVMKQSAKLAEDGWVYKLEASFLEIYNETVVDLLAKGVASKGGLDIKMDPHNPGSTHVPNATRCDITTGACTVTELMETAAKKRSVACTSMNARSSRSHSVFTLHITGVNAAQSTTIKGSLNLCDLAGSERLSRSGAEGDRLKETQAINKSLSALSDVFYSLSKKSTHVPYRNTKLTYLLQHCFNGQGKTLMFLNLSPTEQSAGESLCSLRFGAKVNSTVLGKPVSNKASTKTKKPSGAQETSRAKRHKH